MRSCFFGRNEVTLNELILAFWDKASTIVDEEYWLSPPKESSIEKFGELIATHIPWLLSTYNNANKAKRQEILKVFAQELVLVKENSESNKYIPNNSLVSKDNLRILLAKLDQKYSPVFTGNKSLPKPTDNKPLAKRKVERVVCDERDELTKLKDDILCEVREWQNKFLALAYSKQDWRQYTRVENDEDEDEDEVKKTIWPNQQRHEKNILAALPDELLKALLAHSNKMREEEKKLEEERKLEEEKKLEEGKKLEKGKELKEENELEKGKELDERFETDIVSALIQAAKDTTVAGKISTIGIILLSDYEASWPKRLFDSESELSRVLQPTIVKYSEILQKVSEMSNTDCLISPIQPSKGMAP